MEYIKMTKEQLEAEKLSLLSTYEEYKEKGLSLDMSRGKPAADQLELSMPMLTDPKYSALYRSEDGTDCRNYGVCDGIAEAKRLFSQILEMPLENIVVQGNSSLNIMYDTLLRAMFYGVCGEEPWSKQGVVKFICPVPGYDRHFALCEKMGIEMINVPMTKEGPDTDAIKAIVATDPSVKGMWCVPKYANPDGCICSERTVRELASMKCAAKDFRIFWDNAYVVHSLYGEDELANIFEIAKEYGNEDRVFVFASTSKITFSGAGIAAVGASKKNIDELKSSLMIQTIGHDKLNMLRHVAFLGDINGVREHMRKHAELIRPKFEAVANAFERDLAGTGAAEWTSPRGGYFVSLDVMDGCAKRTYELAKAAGVTLTPAGAAFPYKKDPRDRNLRIAPTYPTLEELKLALSVLTVCVRIAALEACLAK